MQQNQNTAAVIAVLYLMNLIDCSYQHPAQDILSLCSEDVEPKIILGAGEESATLIHLNVNPSHIAAASSLECNINVRPPEGHSVAVVVQQISMRKRHHCLDYIQLDAEDAAMKSPRVCEAVELHSRTGGHLPAISARQVRVTLHMSSHALSDQTSGNISLILVATAYRQASTCDPSTEFACPGVRERVCMWRGVMCDGFINCPPEGVDEHSFLCTMRNTKSVVTVVSGDSRNSSVNRDNTEGNNNTSELTIEDFFALCIMGFLIATTLIFILKIFSECFRSCCGRNRSVRETLTGAAICEEGEADHPFPRPPSYNTCMKDVELTRPPSYSKCIFTLDELEASGLFQAVQVSQEPDGMQAASAVTTKPLESTGTLISCSPASASHLTFESLSSTSISHSGNWLTNNGQLDQCKVFSASTDKLL